MSMTDSQPRHEYQPGIPSLLRSLNERTLLDYLRSHKPTSRASWARDEAFQANRLASACQS